MAIKHAHEVRIGTSGWNYPSTGYGPWTGVFYPLKHGQKIPGTKEKFDELAYYADRFDTVEINNTFYRPPAVKTAPRYWSDGHHKRLRSRLLSADTFNAIRASRFGRRPIRLTV
jgi:uncharacterized protein YecE (DUF72 family)